MNKNSTKSITRKKKAPAAVTKVDGNNITSSPVEDRFARARLRLNPHRQRLLRAILDAADETCFLSSRELAKRYNVDATTILRTTQVLGYKSYADFSTDLRQHFVARITPYAALKAATREKRSVTDHIDHALDKALENLKVLESDLDRQRLIELAKIIKRSRRVLVVGLDFAASLAYYLAYGLCALGFDAEAPVGSTGNLQHKIDLLTEKDLMVAISFGRCLRETVEAVERAHGRGVPTFGITDSDTTPIALHCNDYLVASTSSPSFTGSYVAPMALLNTIIVACAHLRPKRALAMLSRTEQEYRTGTRWYQEPPRKKK